MLSLKSFNAATVKPRNVAAKASSRPLWYPGATAPAHLNGSMPGDYGFDPLSLGSDPESLKWLQAGETINGRWAMAAVAGILFTDVAGFPKFWEVSTLQYALDTQTLILVEVATFGVLEALRYNGWKEKQNCAFFDPAGMNSPETAEKEIKNGRLAMLALIGFGSQHAVTGLGPIDGLKAHLADPNHVNIYTSSVGKETAVFIALLSIWPLLIEASKSKNKAALFPWTAPWSN